MTLSEKIALSLTGLVVLISFFQWLTMLAQIRQIKAQSRLENRAWLGIKQITPHKIEIGNTIRCLVEAANFGKTPALKVRTRAGVTTDPKFDFSGFFKENLPLSCGDCTISQNVPLVIPVSTKGKVVQDLFSQIKRGERNVLVFGRLTYFDIFEEPHETRFCVEWNPTISHYQSYPAYNNMD